VPQAVQPHPLRQLRRAGRQICDHIDRETGVPASVLNTSATSRVVTRCGSRRSFNCAPRTGCAASRAARTSNVHWASGTVRADSADFGAARYSGFGESDTSCAAQGLVARPRHRR
jgi:hypothetical protein